MASNRNELTMLTSSTEDDFKNSTNLSCGDGDGTNGCLLCVNEGYFMTVVMGKAFMMAVIVNMMPQ